MAAFFVGLSLISLVAFLFSAETKDVDIGEMDPAQREIVTRRRGHRGAASGHPAVTARAPRTGGVPPRPPGRVHGGRGRRLEDLRRRVAPPRGGRRAARLGRPLHAGRARAGDGPRARGDGDPRGAARGGRGGGSDRSRGVAVDRGRHADDHRGRLRAGPARCSSCSRAGWPRATPRAPLAVLSCDNVPRNGEVLRRRGDGAADPGVTFPSTVVDRITPASDDPLAS